MGTLPEVWLNEVKAQEILDQLLDSGTCALRLALGNGSAFDLYVAIHTVPPVYEAPVLVIAPDGFPAAILALDKGPVCMPKRFAGLPATDAVGLAYFATQMRFEWSYEVVGSGETWAEFVASAEFQDALRDMGLPAWTQYERRPAGVPEWTQARRPQHDDA